MKHKLEFAEVEPFPDRVRAAMAALGEGRAALERLAKSCCMAERSVTINSAIGVLEATLLSVESVPTTASKVHGAVESVGELGSMVGKLYATCCTPVRDRHYQTFFRALHQTHSNLYGSLGVGH